MPRAALSETEVADFREALCESATRLFAEHGYEGVTMRALATELGCSPMTPYRYFKNKAQIFGAVRSAAFALFADALEDASRNHSSSAARLRALCWAYVHFAIEEPHAYRIMFELDQAKRPDSESAEDLRSWRCMHTAVKEAVAGGVLSGDPEVLANLLWAGVHGLVALHLSGMLVMGHPLEELVEAWIEREFGASKPKQTAPPLPTGSRGNRKGN